MKTISREEIKNWWDELGDDERIQHTKDYGIYGHDEGVYFSDIAGMYYANFSLDGNFFTSGSINLSKII